MPQQPGGPEAGAERGKELLPLQMRCLIGSRSIRIPRLGRHAGAADKPDDAVVGQRFGAFQNRHPTVDHVKRQMLGSAHFRTQGLVQDCYLFGTVESVHPKAASGGIDLADRSDIATHRVAARAA